MSFLIQIEIPLALGMIFFFFGILDILGFITLWILIVSFSRPPLDTVPVGKGGCHLLTAQWESRPLLAAGRGATLTVCGRSAAVPARRFLSCWTTLSWFFGKRAGVCWCFCFCVGISRLLASPTPSSGYIKQKEDLRNTLPCCSSGPEGPS